MNKSIFILSFLSLTISCFSQKVESSKKDLKQQIDNYLKETIEVNEIPGSAVAVIKNGRIIYEHYYGKSSIDDNTLVDENSIFRLYSTTKLITAVGVFQLIEKSKLSLEDKISKYLDNLPKEWQDVKIKNLITHSSGLPDIVKFEDIPYNLDEKEKWIRLYKKPMDFETGNQYSYNQTNYCLLTKIIESVTGLIFEDYILKNQFPTVKKGVVYSANASEFISNRVTHHVFNFKKNKYERFNADHGKIHNSGSGLNITLKEFIAWNERLDKNILLKKATKSLMWKQFEFINKKDDFLYGWSIYSTNNIKSFGFSGGYMTAFRKFTDKNITIIFLSNGYKFFNVEEKVINHLAGIVDESLIDKKLLVEEEITTAFFKNDFAKAKQTYFVLKDENSTLHFEDVLNMIGYTLMNNDRLNDAIKVLEFNLEENPKSFNAFDSLAEGYFNNGQLEISKRNYQKSFELNPENTNAKEMINKIDELLKSQ
ncbi:serine hydrolase domain-containing protein [Flavobacterium sp. TAB 87]|uniref:serine hydrolase domain-containing protein n=1 Tax=Flavobacterium sp. TAB 87 TaxID=1729581 RepID=UPI00076D3577|nr:serine hydrolase domain-containing protein [Flavobacterium sp. TAB 87]KVV16439.1 Penicillin-binding protein E [Flavobacterium sp. TAB 87]